MTKVYKLTSADGYTRKGSSNACKWGPGVTHRAKGTGGLCTEGCIHAYTSPLLAVFINPIHSNITDPLLYEGEMKITHRDKSDLKVGGRELTTTKKIKLPKPSIRQRVCFAILVAKAALGAIDASPLSAINAKVFTVKMAEWNFWASDFLGGKNKSAATARSAAATARSAAHASYAAAYAAAAHAAAHAAYAAAYAAAHAAAHAAYAAAYADAHAAYADAAAHASYAAAHAAAYADHAAALGRLDLAAIAEQAMTY